MNVMLVVVGCLLLAVAFGLFVRLQLLKDPTQKTETLVGLSSFLSGVFGLMILFKGIFP